MGNVLEKKRKDVSTHARRAGTAQSTSGLAGAPLRRMMHSLQIIVVQAGRPLPQLPPASRRRHRGMQQRRQCCPDRRMQDTGQYFCGDTARLQ
jgi:hypothetical protein